MSKPWEQYAKPPPAEETGPWSRYQPAKPPPEPTSIGERLWTGFTDPVYGAAQLADRVIVNPIRQMISPGASSMEDVIRERDKDYQAPEGMDWARTAGNLINPINWAGGGGTAATRAGAAIAEKLPAAFKTATATAAGAGALQSALTPTAADQSAGDFVAEKTKQLVAGGATAAGLAKVLPRVLSATPIKPTAEAAALQRQGVTLTPGQAAGGIVGDIEQKLTSVPVAGDIIKGARSRALDEVQQRAIARATGMKGAKTIDEANQAVSNMYQAVVPKLKPTPEATVDVLGAVVKAADNPELTAGNRQLLEGLHDKLFGAGGGRYMQLSGDSLKDLDTELGALGRKYAKSVLPSDQTLADEIYNIQQAMRNAWAYHLDPADVAKLDAANSAYRQMVPINKAASQRADELATPRALQKALARQAGKDVTRMAYDPLIDPAVSVLRSTVPDSGTAGRLAIPAAIAGAYAAPLSTAATIGGTLAAYSRPGSNILTGNTRLQQWLQQNVDPRGSPAARKAILAALRASQADSGGRQPEE